MLDIPKFVGELHDYISRAFRPVIDRLKALEDRAPVPGPKGDAGDRGPPGERGAPGQDAVLDLEDVEKVISRVVENSIARHALEFEIRAGKALQNVVDRMPVPKDGKDGTDFADVQFEFDGERSLTIRPKHGTPIVKRLVIPVYRGYWREGMKCERADILTHEGTAWIALRDTATEPATSNKEDWSIFARKGRDK